MTTPAPAPAQEAEERIERDIDIWNPGGDPGVLRERAGEWRTKAGELREGSGALDTAVAGVADSWRCPAADEFARYWRELSTGTEQMAGAFEEVAQNLDDTADEIERINDEVRRIYVEIGVTIAAGVALSFVTMGFSSLVGAGAAAAAASRAAALVARLGTFLMQMRGLLAASRTAMAAKALVFSQRMATTGRAGAAAAQVVTTSVRVGGQAAGVTGRLAGNEFVQRTAINAAGNVGARSLYYGADGDDATSANPLDWDGRDWAAVGISSMMSAGLAMAGARLPGIVGRSSVGRASTEGYVGALSASIINNTVVAGQPFRSTTLHDARHAARVSAVTTGAVRSGREGIIRPHLPAGSRTPGVVNRGSPSHLVEAPFKVPADGLGKGALPFVPGFGPSDPIITRPAGAPAATGPIDPTLPSPAPVAAPPVARPPGATAPPSSAGPDRPAVQRPGGGSEAVPDPGAAVTPDALPTVIVRPGDSLSQIADRELGDRDRWPDILDLNIGIINDPDLIFPGQELQLPPVTPAPVG